VSIEPGTLYVVATPIGNLGDISQRAMTVLTAVNLVAAEDTRHSQRLLSLLGLTNRLLSLHEHNEEARVEEVLGELQKQGSVALICDAGTPLISDPGYRLVREAQQRGYPVRPVPGPCSPVAALSVAGLPTDRFVFEGFLPAKTQARMARLKQLESETRTMLFMESPHRVEATLADMLVVFGAEREAVLARELTKLHEQTLRTSLGELQARAKREPDLRRGEIVLLLRGGDRPQSALDKDLRRLLELLSAELPPARAAAVAARISGRSRRELYDQLRQISSDS
jgi:16S rRNA (cytidine1402-2'-O)-methyltransferase